MAQTPKTPASRLWPSLGTESTPIPPIAPMNTPVSISTPFTPMSLPKVEEGDDMVETESTGIPNISHDILDSDRCISQVKASESAAVEELAVKSFKLIDSQEQVQLVVRRAEYAENEVQHLKGVIGTMELSTEHHVRTCSELQVENKNLKVEVSDLKNQVLIGRSSQELLIDNNSELTNEVTDVRRQLEENKVIIEALRKDIKSYQLLHQSQPSYMYSELVNQTRINLQDENKSLKDKVYLLNSKMKNNNLKDQSQIQDSDMLINDEIVLNKENSVPSD